MGLFDTNLLSAFAPKTYAGLNSAFGYVPPDEMIAQLVQHPAYKAFADLLAQNQAAFGRARIMNGANADHRAKLADGNQYQVGNVTVVMSKDASTVGAFGGNGPEVLAAFTTLRGRFAEGSAERARLDEDIANLNTRLGQKP